MTREYLLYGNVLKISDLDGASIEAMFNIFSRYFTEISKEKFLNDLYEKDCALVLLDSKKAIQGFTTIKFIEIEIAGKRIRAIFSGNTILEKEYWGKSDIARSWMEYMLAEKEKDPEIPLYWFLICSGYKTYKMLANYANNFYPRWDCETPANIKEIIDHLAQKRFGSDYDPVSGIIKFSNTGERLRGEYSVIAPILLIDPHIEFFARLNPGHNLGHELACLAEVKLENLNQYAISLLND